MPTRCPTLRPTKWQGDSKSAPSPHPWQPDNSRGGEAILGIALPPNGPSGWGGGVGSSSPAPPHESSGYWNGVGGLAAAPSPHPIGPTTRRVAGQFRESHSHPTSCWNWPHHPTGCRATGVVWGGLVAAPPPHPDSPTARGVARQISSPPRRLSSHRGGVGGLPPTLLPHLEGPTLAPPPHPGGL